MISWFGCVRKTYNWALECIKQDPKNYKINVPALRKHFVTAAAIPEDKKYLLDCPKHVRDGALKDLVVAFKSNFTKRANNSDHKFDISFRSRKHGEAAITIPKEAIKLIEQGKQLQMYPTYLQNFLKLKTRNRDQPLQEINHDCKLVLDRLGRFYLLVPIKKSVTPSNSQGWVALDPGCRTFQTMYSPYQGHSFKYGDKDANRLFRLLKTLDGLPDKKRKQREKLRLRVKHLVDEVHWKTVRFLLDNYDNILIPVFEVQSMIRKVDRKIRKKVVRQMLSWRHYEFRQRLMFKAKQENKNVFVVGEEYTTKTCTQCFAINPNVGGSKTFKCLCCGLQADRDAMGSRNIFIKNISVMET